ncbi:MAG: orotidine-5'-phosphate decarboxylase [Planctomycetota bacterium]|nr:orotidine-5'-phosphate decarboxylase [Planctomycetota bacterium]
MGSHFGDRLAKSCAEKDSFVCVGLDPRWGSLPDSIRQGVSPTDLQAVAVATQCYCQEVIDAVAEFSPVVKPQAAFFENLGPHGMQALWGIVQHARKAGLIVLLDGKRGDIGSTAQGYAEAYLGYESPWQCDALTVNPYLGDDTLAPFHQAATDNGAGVFVLVKTSNPGSGFLQDLQFGEPADSKAIYEHVAAHVESLAASHTGESGMGSIGAVVGATYPEQLAELRAKMPHAWILIPGFGAQGGTVEDVKHGFRLIDGTSTGAIVNSSRGIIFAYQKDNSASDWQTAVAAAAKEMRDQLRAI